MTIKKKRPGGLLQFVKAVRVRQMFTDSQSCMPWQSLHVKSFISCVTSRARACGDSVNGGMPAALRHGTGSWQSPLQMVNPFQHQDVADSGLKYLLLHHGRELNLAAVWTPGLTVELALPLL